MSRFRGVPIFLHGWFPVVFFLHPPASRLGRWETTSFFNNLWDAAWIRSQELADGVIDFDKALRDPANPAQMQETYQSDWLHPNDAGYQKMAEVAVKVLEN